MISLLTPDRLPSVVHAFENTQTDNVKELLIDDTKITHMLQQPVFCLLVLNKVPPLEA